MDRVMSSRSRTVVLVGLVALSLCGFLDIGTEAQEQDYYESASSSPADWNNGTSEKKDGQCQDGLLIPMWMPYENLTIGDRIARGLVYFIAMCYLFVGVSIVADRFMGAIEVITSKEKEIRIKKANGDVQIVVVRVWNETVANLSLMALGSSAPEILLSIIEVYAKNFEAGDLGPSLSLSGPSARPSSYLQTTVTM